VNLAFMIALFAAAVTILCKFVVAAIGAAVITVNSDAVVFDCKL